LEKGPKRCNGGAEGYQAEDGTESGKTACDQSDFGFHHSPEETVRDYANNVIGWHAHDSNLFEAVYHFIR
jgi:hypothetical protein